MKSSSPHGASAASTSDGGAVRRLAGKVKRVLRIGARSASKEGGGQAGAAAEGSTEAFSQERAMLRNVLALRQARVADVMGTARGHRRRSGRRQPRRALEGLSQCRAFPPARLRRDPR